MKIDKVLPYFIEKSNDVDEFVKLQERLFGMGYKWLNGQDIFTAKTFISYPVYVSNLSFTDISSIKKFEMLRDNYNEYSNNIIFFDKDMNLFDLRLLRKLKLERINENVQ